MSTRPPPAWSPAATQPNAQHPSKKASSFASSHASSDYHRNHRNTNNNTHPQYASDKMNHSGHAAGSEEDDEDAAQVYLPCGNPFIMFDDMVYDPSVPGALPDTLAALGDPMATCFLSVGGSAVPGGSGAGAGAGGAALPSRQPKAQALVDALIRYRLEVVNSVPPLPLPPQRKQKTSAAKTKRREGGASTISSIQPSTTHNSVVAGAAADGLFSGRSSGKGSVSRHRASIATQPDDVQEEDDGGGAWGGGKSANDDEDAFGGGRGGGGFGAWGQDDGGDASHQDHHAGGGGGGGDVYAPSSMDAFKRFVIAFRAQRLELAAAEALVEQATRLCNAPSSSTSSSSSSSSSSRRLRALDLFAAADELSAPTDEAAASLLHLGSGAASIADLVADASQFLYYLRGVVRLRLLKGLLVLRHREAATSGGGSGAARTALGLADIAIAIARDYQLDHELPELFLSRGAVRLQCDSGRERDALEDGIAALAAVEDILLLAERLEQHEQHQQRQQGDDGGGGSGITNTEADGAGGAELSRARTLAAMTAAQPNPRESTTLAAFARWQAHVAACRQHRSTSVYEPTLSGPVPAHTPLVVTAEVRAAEEATINPLRYVLTTRPRGGARPAPFLELVAQQRDAYFQTQQEQQSGTAAQKAPAPSSSPARAHGLPPAVATWGAALALCYRHVALCEGRLGNWHGAHAAARVAHHTAQQVLPDAHPVAGLCRETLLQATTVAATQQAVHHHPVVRRPRTALVKGPPLPAKGALFGDIAARRSAVERHRVPRPAWNQSFASAIPPSAALLREVAVLVQEQEAREAAGLALATTTRSTTPADGGIAAQRGGRDDLRRDFSSSDAGRGAALGPLRGMSLFSSGDRQRRPSQQLPPRRSTVQGAGAGTTAVGSGGHTNTNNEDDAAVREIFASAVRGGGSAMLTAPSNAQTAEHSRSGSIGGVEEEEQRYIISQQQHQHQPKQHHQQQRPLSAADYSYLRQVYKLRWDPTMAFTRQIRYSPYRQDASFHLRSGDCTLTTTSRRHNNSSGSGASRSAVIRGHSLPSTAMALLMSGSSYPHDDEEDEEG